jgi:hypothetical protein
VVLSSNDSVAAAAAEPAHGGLITFNVATNKDRPTFRQCALP